MFDCSQLIDACGLTITEGKRKTSPAGAALSRFEYA